MEKIPTYFNFHENEKKNPHYFLSEELLVPRANSCDAQRLNLWSNHINQLVHLVKPDFPKVFTNFENQIGEYSIAYKKLEETAKVIAKIRKNQFNYDLIIQYKETGIFDIIHYNYARNIGEDYGYTLEDFNSELKTGDTIEKGEFLYKSTNYDKDGNFSYGRNLKSVFLPYKGLTYEDGIVISKSAAEKLASFKIEKTMFSINTNDILLNLYGNEKKYKSFPRVGETLKSKILVASRRKDKYSILYDFQTEKMREVDPTNDEIIYTNGGLVVDINLFLNTPFEILKKREDEFSKEIFSLLKEQNRYWNEIKTELEKIIPCKVLSEAEEKKERDEFGFVTKHPISKEENENKYSNELGYCWKYSHEITDEKITWRDNGKSFDNFKIEFTILKENPLMAGSKLTGRYGNKGVVTTIVDDEEMPTAENGEKAEVVLNALGVINRLNLSQIQEQYINFMSDHIVKLIKEKKTLEEKIELFLLYLKNLSKDEFTFFNSEIKKMTKEEKEVLIRDTITNGIFIHQTPFFGNITMEDFERIFSEFPEWCEKYKFKNIEKPLVMGDMYFVRLKHEGSNKSSMRSANNLNVKNLPAKSTLKKEKKILHSSTPIRLGEMEVTNLFLAKKPEIVERLLKTYSTNNEMREELIKKLVSPGNTEGKKDNPLNFSLDLPNEKSINREILERYLNVLELGLIDADDEKKA